VADDLHADTFAPHEGTTFTLSRDGGGPIPLVLARVEPGPDQPHAPRQDPFSLWFTGPPDDAVDQGVYRLDHDTLGGLDVFLVPRKPETDGLSRYEAVFN
jgi:hypothetical protein